MSRVFHERGSTCVWIRYDEHGNVLLIGQDLGGAMGTSEYEYNIRIFRADFDRVREALGVDPATDVIDAMCANASMIFRAGERTWLESLGIEVGFANWFHFDD